MGRPGERAAFGVRVGLGLSVRAWWATRRRPPANGEEAVAGGVVEAVFVSPQGGSPMCQVDEVHALAGRGLEGDRYLARTGYWTGVDECQVTLIEAEALEEITARGDVDVAAGQHRRNLVTRGVELRSLAGRRFRVGEAVLEYDRPRPPCRYIQSITEPGMTRALGGRRGGICARVVTSGPIRPGDSLELLA